MRRRARSCSTRGILLSKPVQRLPYRRARRQDGTGPRGVTARRDRAWLTVTSSSGQDARRGRSDRGRPVEKYQYARMPNLPSARTNGRSAFVRGGAERTPHEPARKDRSPPVRSELPRRLRSGFVLRLCGSRTSVFIQADEDLPALEIALRAGL